MITAEELENCDIFPKKYTFTCILKFCIYLLFMFVAFIFLYSFYSERDIKSIILLESFKKTENDLITNIYLNTPQNYYKNQEKYILNFDEDISEILMKYINDNHPCLIKNANSSSLDLFSYYNELLKLYENSISQFNIEIRNDPLTEFYDKKFKYTKSNYQEYLTNSQKNKKLFINDINIIEIVSLDNENKLNELYNNFISLKILKKYLKSEGVFYSEGNDKVITGGHSESSDNFICLIEGEVDIMLIPATERALVYPFHKGKEMNNYSPINFYKSDFDKYPSFQNTTRILFTISKGDCIYIPSFWWRSVKSTEGKLFKFISFKYASSSRYVNEFFNRLQLEEF